MYELIDCGNNEQSDSNTISQQACVIFTTIQCKTGATADHYREQKFRNNNADIHNIAGTHVNELNSVSTRCSKCDNRRWEARLH